MNNGILGLHRRQLQNGLVYLGRRAFQNTTFVPFLKEFSPDIDEYELLLNNIVQSLGGASEQVYLRFSVDGASVDTSVNYPDARWMFSSSGSVGAAGGAANSALLVSFADNDANWGGSAKCTIFINNRGLYTHMVSKQFWRDQNQGTDVPQGSVQAGIFRNVKRPRGFAIICVAGTFSGEARLYGYLKR